MEHHITQVTASQLTNSTASHFKSDEGMGGGGTTSNMKSQNTHSGMYKLTCPECNKAYVGQTSRNFTTRFNEHKNAFKTNSHSSKFVQHLVEHTNSLGTTNSTMQVLRWQNKGAHLHTVEKYYIYTEYTKDNHMNDNQTIFPNKIFDAILNPHQPYPHHPPQSLEWSHNPSPHTGTFFNIKAKQLRSSRSIRLHTSHPGVTQWSGFFFY